MLHPSKCPHGVWWPICDKIAIFCQCCNPKYGLDSRATPAKKSRKRKNTVNELPEAA